MRSPLALLALIALVLQARAQTYTWNGGGGNGNWNTAANWTGGVPASANNTVIELSGTTQTSTTQNITSPFTLNQLNMLSDATSGFVVGGGQLRFDGNGAQITSRAGAVLRVNSAIEFAANTTIDLAINNPVGREGQFTGPLTAATGTTVTFTTSNNPGTIAVLQGTNYGFRGTLAVSGGAVVHTTGANTVARTATVNTVGALSVYTVGTLAASGLAPTGANVQLGSVGGSGEFSLGDASITSSALVGLNNANVIYGGTLVAGNVNSHLGKVGTGVWQLDGTTAGTVDGTFSVRDGMVNLSGNSSTSGGFGTTSAGNIQIYTGGELRVSIAGNQDNGRIGDSQAVALRGGVVRLSGGQLTGSANGFSEDVGALTVAAGQSTVRVDTSPFRGARFNFASLANPASTTGTVVFLSDSLGLTPLDNAGAGNVAFATAPTAQLVGTTTTYGASTTDLAILPYGSAGTATGGVPTTFATYDSANGSVRGLADTNYAPALGTATNNVSLATDATVSSATTANALRLTAGGSVDNNTLNNTLTLTSGALLNNGGGNVTGNGTLAFGAGGTRTAYITTTGGSTIGNAISAANLSKNGAGNLTLTNTTTLTGTAGNTVAVNAGTLTLANTAAVTTSTALSGTNTLTYQVSRGATLNVAGFSGGYTIGQFQTLTGGGTSTNPLSTSSAKVVGNVVVDSGGTVTPSTLGGSQASLLSPGTLVVDGNLKLNGGSTYVWAVNSAVTDGDNTVAPEAGTLANYKSVYTSSLLSTTGTLDLAGASAGNRIILKPTSLGLSNDSGAVYDLFDGNTRSWVLMEAGTTINEFSADKFTLDTSAFQNVDASRLSVNRVGNSIVLTFSPVPEPAGMLALAAGVGAVVMAWRRARRRTVVASPTNAA